MEITDKWIQLGYAIKTVLKIVGILEATTYYARRKSQGKLKVYNSGRPVPGFSMKTDGQPVADEQIKEWIHEYLVDEEAAYGYRKITVCLRRDHGLQINKKKVYRLMKEENLLHPQREKQRKYPRKLANNREIMDSNQLWEMDVKCGFIAGEQRFFFLLSLIDVYDRSVIDYHIRLNCEGKHASQVLQRALI
ncbi:IS3 family transposase [Aneurinibacillus aneurinilyticus]|uniref:IS3 family transposase n=1 Tax=Aneurinibacillus aneurinilyticus TaxID=1391 RepID=UPI003524D577